MYVFKNILQDKTILFCYEKSIFCLCITKALFLWIFSSRFSCQDTQNDVKRLEKWFRINVRICVCVCVCVCWNFGKFKFLYLRNHSADRAKILCVPKAYATLPLIPFSLKLIHGLGFYDNLTFFKNICNRSSCSKF